VSVSVSMSSVISISPRQKRATCIKELKSIVDNVNNNSVSAGKSTIHNVDNVKEKLQELLLIAIKSPFIHLSDLKEYISLLETLLGPVLHEYYPFFSEEFKRNTFDAFFLPKSSMVNENNNNNTSSSNDRIASVALCFMGYSKNFKSCMDMITNKNVDNMYVAAELSRLFLKSFYQNNHSEKKLHELFQAMLEINDQIFLKEMLNHLTSMPDRVCTLLVSKKKTPTIFYPNKYFNWIIKAFATFLFSLEISDVNWKNVISNIFTKFIVNGYTTLIIKCLLEQCLDSQKLFLSKNVSSMATRKSQFLTIFGKLVACIDLKSLQKFIKELLYQAFNHIESDASNTNDMQEQKQQLYEYILYKVFKPMLNANAEILYILQNQILLNQRIGQIGSKFCIKLLCIGNTTTNETNTKKRSAHAINTFHMLLKLWSNSSFISTSDYRQHLHVTKLLLYAFEWTTSKDVEEATTLPLLLSGVQNHMESELPKKRKLGMLVARKFSKILNMMDSLDFGESLTDEDKSIDSGIEQRIVLPQTIVVRNSEDDGNSELNDTIRRSIEPQQCHRQEIDDEAESDSISDSSNESTSSDDDDDDLVPYDISADNEESVMSSKNEIIKAPLYIVDCIKGLTVKDDFNVYHLALKSLEKVIQRKDRGLKYYAIQLCNVLLRMDNKYNLEEFDEIRNNALISMLVSAPKVVVEYLTQEFFRDEYGLSHRHLMLNTLLEGAKKLANIEDSKHLITTATSDDGDTFISEEKFFDGRVVKTYKSTQPTLGKVVKRFKTTSGTQLKQLQGKTNMFNNYAGYFFFPLASKYDYKIRTLDLLGRDSRLLGSLLFVLGTFVELGCNSMIGPQMGATMLELIHALKGHPSHQVRRFLLYALSRVLVNIKLDLLQTWFVGSFHDIGQWLKHTALKDNDDECRKRALALVKLKIFSIATQ
jgi:hypothetical protein